MLLSRISALTKEKLRREEWEVMLARSKLQRTMHGQEEFEMDLCRMYKI